MRERPSEATQQAADWLVQLHSPDRSPNTEAEFADWLRASPIHVREYLRAVEVWEGLAHESVGQDSSQEQLVWDANAAGVIEFPRELRAAAKSASPIRSLPVAMRRGTALAALFAGMVLASGYFGWRHFTALDVATGIGEQRSVVLPDRSIVELNTQSEIRLAFTATERRVELVRGEAFFDVSKDPARPFIVATDLATARAVGTRFSMYRTPTGTVVTVAEGRVLVRDALAATDSLAESADFAGAVEVIPGTQAEARLDRSVQLRQADVERSLAWRQRKLIFNGEPLWSVVDEFNRYNSPPLVIVDPRQRDQRISGVFGANDPDSLIDFLVKVDRIPVTRTDRRDIRIGSDPH